MATKETIHNEEAIPEEAIPDEAVRSDLHEEDDTEPHVHDAELEAYEEGPPAARVAPDPEAPAEAAHEEPEDDHAVEGVLEQGAVALVALEELELRPVCERFVALQLTRGGEIDQPVPGGQRETHETRRDRDGAPEWRFRRVHDVDVRQGALGRARRAPERDPTRDDDRDEDEAAHPQHDQPQRMDVLRLRSGG